MAGQQHDEFGELERQLAAIEPQASRLDRADLLFRAGQESVRLHKPEASPWSRMWQLSTALLAVVTLGLSWQLYNTQPETVERIRYVQVSTEKSLTEKSLAEESVLVEERPRVVQPTGEPELLREHYLQQRRLAVGLGIDALGDHSSRNNAVPSSLTSYRDLKASYFDRHESSGDDARRSERNQQL